MAFGAAVVSRLILLTRILEASVEDLAGEMDLKCPTLRKRRHRAEAALAALGTV